MVKLHAVCKKNVLMECLWDNKSASCHLVYLSHFLATIALCGLLPSWMYNQVAKKLPKVATEVNGFEIDVRGSWGQKDFRLLNPFSLDNPPKASEKQF